MGLPAGNQSSNFSNPGFASVTDSGSYAQTVIHNGSGGRLRRRAQSAQTRDARHYPRRNSEPGERLRTLPVFPSSSFIGCGVSCARRAWPDRPSSRRRSRGGASGSHCLILWWFSWAVACPSVIEIALANRWHRDTQRRSTSARGGGTATASLARSCDWAPRVTTRPSYASTTARSWATCEG